MIARALVSVFKEWRYLFIASVTAFLVFLLATWLPNLGLIRQIAFIPSIPILDKIHIFVSFVGSITTNFTIFSGMYTTTIAILFGMNVAMVTYYLKQQKKLRAQSSQASAAASLSGLASGFFGIGCGACGTFVLGPVLSFLGAAGLVAALPLEGQEFGLLGVGILCFSIFLVAKKLDEPFACTISVAASSQPEN